MSWLSGLFSKGKQTSTELVDPQKAQLSVTDYCKRGQKLINEGKLTQALEYYQAATEIDEDSAVALRGMLTIYQMMGKIDKVAEITQKLEILTPRKPAQNTPGLSLDIQLENEMKRYMNMIYTMLVIETDEYGLRLGSFSNEDNDVLLESEKSIHELEKSLGKKETDFVKIKDGVFNQYCSKSSQIQAIINDLYTKYSRICEEQLINENGAYTFTPETLKALGLIEDKIKSLDFYLHHTTDAKTFQEKRNEAITNQLFSDYKTICQENVIEVEGVYGYADNILLELKEIETKIQNLNPQKTYTSRLTQTRGYAIRDQIQKLYKDLLVKYLKKKRNDGGTTYVIADDALMKERSLRSQIVTLMGEQGNKWCNNEIKNAEKQKRENAKQANKFIGIAIGVVAVVTLFILFTEVMLYILLGIVGLIVLLFYAGQQH
jgi:tetratricopeptide (TPR) repeat protein